MRPADEVCAADLRMGERGSGGYEGITSGAEGRIAQALATADAVGAGLHGATRGTRRPCAAAAMSEETSRSGLAASRII